MQFPQITTALEVSTFTYTIKYPDGRIEHHTGTVRKEPSVSPRKDIEEEEAKECQAKIVTNATRVRRNGSQIETAATWFST